MQSYFGLLSRSSKAVANALRPTYGSIFRSFNMKPTVVALNQRAGPSRQRWDDFADDHVLVTQQEWEMFNGAYSTHMGDPQYEKLMNENITENHVRHDQLPLSQIDVEKVWASNAASIRTLGPPAGTYDGRTVPVRNGRIIPAYAALSKIMSTNNVWMELRRTARHEKKGDMRRRLESERWRKRFQREVREKVKLVRHMRRLDAT